MPNLIKGVRYVQKKQFLLQVKDWYQTICKFQLLLRASNGHMNHWAGKLN